MRGPRWAIVPAKSLARGKSRLSGVLDAEARAAFARSLLEHVLQTLRRSELDGLLVATDGDDIAELARASGARVARDQGARSLREVVDRALVEVASLGAAAALVLMADLPRIEPGDIRTVLEALEDHEVVVVKDHAGLHTNALALAPPTAIPTCFGRRDSFEAHCAAARAAGLRLAIIENARIAFDVDGPEDHARLTLPDPVPDLSTVGATRASTDATRTEPLRTSEATPARPGGGT